MKLSLSADDRISPDFSSDKDGNSLVRWLIWAGLVPLTLLAVAASGWYVVTGETPDDLADNWLSSTRISLPMPPRLGPEKSAASLLRPPSLQQANDPDVKMTMAAIPATPSPATTPSTPPANRFPATRRRDITGRNPIQSAGNTGRGTTQASGGGPDGAPNRADILRFRSGGPHGRSRDGRQSRREKLDHRAAAAARAR